VRDARLHPPVQMQPGTYYVPPVHPYP
jgi:hypothetical protein